MTELTNEAVAKALGLVPDENGQWFTAEGEWFPGTTDDWRSNEPTPDWLHDIAACQRDVWDKLPRGWALWSTSGQEVSTMYLIHFAGRCISGGRWWDTAEQAFCAALLELTK